MDRETLDQLIKVSDDPLIWAKIAILLKDRPQVELQALADIAKVLSETAWDVARSHDWYLAT